jgi:hypothetical protein
MPKKCRYVPNRSKPRVFTAKDVARIAGYAVADGANPIELTALVAKACGLAWIFCIAAKSLELYNLILQIIAEVGGVLAVIAVINKVVAFLEGGAALKVPVLNRVVVVAILALVALQKVLNAIQLVIDQYGDMEEARTAIIEICEKTKEV